MVGVIVQQMGEHGRLRKEVQLCSFHLLRFVKKALLHFPLLSGWWLVDTWDRALLVMGHRCQNSLSRRPFNLLFVNLIEANKDCTALLAFIFGWLPEMRVCMFKLHSSVFHYLKYHWLYFVLIFNCTSVFKIVFICIKFWVKEQLENI